MGHYGIAVRRSRPAGHQNSSKRLSAKPGPFLFSGIAEHLSFPSNENTKKGLSPRGSWPVTFLDAGGGRAGLSPTWGTSLPRGASKRIKKKLIFVFRKKKVDAKSQVLA